MELLEEIEYVGDIPEGWKWVKLGEIAEIIKGRKPETLIENPKENSLPYLTAEYFRYRLPSQFVKIEKERNLPVCEKDDIILIWDGSQAGQVFTGLKGILASTMVKIIPNLDKVDKAYLYFFLTTKFEYLNSQATGSAIPHVSKNAFLNLPIPLPPLPEQKAIAEVLSSLDDKIELLHRQNKTLEKMAMTLFRQWFIEPTRDGLPEGWEEVSLGNIFDIGIGRTPPRKESQWFSVNQHDIRWISVKDLGSIDTYILNSSEFLKEESVKEFNIPIIPDNTVVLSFKLTVGRIGITIGEMVSNEAIAHFKPKPDSKISSNYLYLFLKTLDFSTFGSTSSIAEAINSKIIKEIKIHVPDDELITSFQSLINPVFQKIRLNTLEIQTLEKLRDTLLPKLMSGEAKIMNNEQ